MSLTLQIAITNDFNGDTIIALKEPISFKEPSEDLKRLTTEPYLIQRLIDDARDVLSIKAELVKKHVPRYEWSGK